MASLAVSTASTTVCATCSSRSAGASSPRSRACAASDRAAASTPTPTWPARTCRRSRPWRSGPSRAPRCGSAPSAPPAWQGRQRSAPSPVLAPRRASCESLAVSAQVGCHQARSAVRISAGPSGDRLRPAARWSPRPGRATARPVPTGQPSPCSTPPRPAGPPRLPAAARPPAWPSPEGSNPACCPSSRSTPKITYLKIHAT